MVKKTSIEWTTHSSNPIKYRDAAGKSVWGCVRKSPGCAHCYSADLAKRYGRGGAFTEAEMAGYECYIDEAELKQLLSVKRLPAGSKVFVGDMTDVFGEWVPFEFLDRLFAVFALRPDVVFQVLTKRPERMREYMGESLREYEPGAWHVTRALVAGVAGRDYLGPGVWISRPSLMPWPLPNVWLGTSVENQRWADIRIPQLLATPAAVHWVSYEPALGPVDFRTYFHESTCALQHDWTDICTCSEPFEYRVGWVVCGGESGPKARPFDVAWARSVVEQCRAAGVAVFYKQGGKSNRCPHSSKGGCQDCMPADLRVREMPL